MKMRFWQKTYIFTLVLFLVCLNVGVLSLTVYTYRKNVEAAETATAAEQYYVAMCFERDYRDMNREHSPLKQADDAVLVDSSDMTIEEVIDKIISLCEEKK